jgi:ABC-2 type transport system permease protein
MYRKYLKVLSIVSQEGAQYRLNYLLSFLCVIFPLLAIVLLWNTVYGEVELVKGYTKSMMVTYYILAALVGDLVAVVLWMDITSDIRDGTLSNYLLRPINYRVYNFCVKMASNASYSLIVLGVIVVFIFLFARNLFLPNLGYFFLFLLSLCFSIILGFEITYLFSLSAFWTKENTGLSYCTNFFIPILMGSILPLDLFPTTIYKIVGYLPFKYLLYFPINIFLEKVSLTEIGYGFIIQAMWIGVAYFVGEWIWRMGIKKYSAVGG